MTMDHHAFGARYDVAVVGARVAGAATAMLLARAGARVLLVDRGEYGSDTLSTHALMRGAVLQLERWGLVPGIIAADTPAITHTTFHFGETATTVPIKPRHGVSALYAPRRTVLDRLLVDAAVDAGADVHFGARLVDLLRAPSGRVNGAVLLDRSGASQRVAFDCVVGADGMRSAVARLVGAPVYREGRYASGVVYGYWRGGRGSSYEWYYGNQMTAGAIATNDSDVLVFAGVPSTAWHQAFGGDRREGFLRVLRATAPELAAQLDALGPASLPEPLIGFSGQKGFFRQSHGAGWALVGDAGYFKDPCTAHGITDALRDAELLAAAVLRDSYGALAGYQRVRDELSNRVFELTDTIASFAWTEESIAPLTEALAREMSEEVKVMASPLVLQATA
jgi:flavin-dependent dehydrogenase